MSALIIKLNGEIEQSNFDAWKTELTEQLDAVKTDLSNDADFAAASDNVKAFKKAEKNLKKAKASAIKQASSINDLFAAIDDIASQTRKVRLKLEKQIKSRKAEIKQQAIVAAQAKVQGFIDAQSDDFKLIDQHEFVDVNIFKEAIKGSRSGSGMAKSLDTVCTQLEEKIRARALQVKNNGIALAALPAASSVAFQDRAMLLALTPDALNNIIDERLAEFEKSRAPADDNTAPATSENTEDTPTSDAAEPDHTASAAPADNANGEAAIPDPFAVIAEDDASDSFEITLHIKTGEKTAIAIMDALKQQYGDKPGFVEVSLRATIA